MSVNTSLSVNTFESLTSPGFHCKVCKNEDLARLYLRLSLGCARNCVASPSFILFVKY